MALTEAMASGYEARLIVTPKRVDESTNQSLSNIVLKVVKVSAGASSFGSGSANQWWLDLNGVRAYGGQWSYSFSSGSVQEKVLLNVDRWIEHQPDGTKDVLFSSSVVSASIGSATPDAVISLPNIARASTFTISQSHTDAGGVLGFTIARSSATFTHRLRYAFEGSGSVTIATGVGTSYSWTIPTSLLNQIPDSTIGYGNLYVDTYNGSTLVGTSNPTAFAVRAGPAVVPTVTGFTAAESVSSVATLVGAFVQSLSKPTISITGAAGVFGSTIESATIDVGGQIITLVEPAGGGPLPMSGTVPQVVAGSGSVPVKVTVTDSRGRTGEATGTISVLAYLPPSLGTTLSVQRTSDAAGNTPNDDGTYARINLTTRIQSLMVSSSQKNAGSYQLRYRPAGSAASVPWTLDTNTTARPVGTSSTAIMASATVPVNDGREYQITLSDRFGFVLGVFSLASQILVHLDGSTGVGVRKRRQRGALDLLGDIYASGAMYVGAALSRLLSVADFSTQTQAEAGTTHTTVMTPLRVAQAIAKTIAAQPKIQTGIVPVPSVPANGSVNVTVTFPVPFSAAPIVNAIPTTSDRLTVVLLTVSATGMELRFTNRTGIATTADAHWQAVLT